MCVFRHTPPKKGRGIPEGATSLVIYKVLDIFICIFIQLKEVKNLIIRQSNLFFHI